MRLPEGKLREKEAERTFAVIMTTVFPNLMADRTYTSKNLNEHYVPYWGTLNQIVESQRQNPKSDERWLITYKTSSIRLTTNFSSGIM